MRHCDHYKKHRRQRLPCLKVLRSTIGATDRTLHVAAKTLNTADQTLNAAQQTLNTFKPGSDTHYQLQQMLQELTQAAFLYSSNG